MKDALPIVLLILFACLLYFVFYWTAKYLCLGLIMLAIAIF